MAYSKPNLEICADDVKASHVTIVATSILKIFLFDSSGIPKIHRRIPIGLRICKEIIDQIPNAWAKRKSPSGHSLKPMKTCAKIFQSFKKKFMATRSSI